MYVGTIPLPVDASISREQVRRRIVDYAVCRVQVEPIVCTLNVCTLSESYCSAIYLNISSGCQTSVGIQPQPFNGISLIDPPESTPRTSPPQSLITKCDVISLSSAAIKYIGSTVIAIANGRIVQRSENISS